MAAQFTTTNGPAGAIAGRVDGAREQLLARAGLAQERDGAARPRRLSRLFEDSPERRARPQDPAEVLADGPPQLEVLPLDPLRLASQGLVEPGVLQSHRDVPGHGIEKIEVVLA